MRFAIQDRNSEEMKEFLAMVKDLPAADIVLWDGNSGTRYVIRNVYYGDEEINVDLVKESGH